MFSTLMVFLIIYVLIFLILQKDWNLDGESILLEKPFSTHVEGEIFHARFFRKNDSYYFQNDDFRKKIFISTDYFSLRHAFKNPQIQEILLKIFQSKLIFGFYIKDSKIIIKLLLTKNNRKQVNEQRAHLALTVRHEVDKLIPLLEQELNKVQDNEDIVSDAIRYGRLVKNSLRHFGAFIVACFIQFIYTQAHFMGQMMLIQSFPVIWIIFIGSLVSLGGASYFFYQLKNSQRKHFLYFPSIILFFISFLFSYNILTAINFYFDKSTAQNHVISYSLHTSHGKSTSYHLDIVSTDNFVQGLIAGQSFTIDSTVYMRLSQFQWANIEIHQGALNVSYISSITPIETHLSTAPLD